MTKIFKYIDIPTFRTLLSHRSHHAYYLFFLKDNLNTLINIDYFYISSEYGGELRELFKEFISLFSEVTNLISSRCYSYENGLISYSSLTKNISPDKQYETTKLLISLNNVLNEIIKIVEINYVNHFNISEFSQSAWEAYMEESSET